MFASISEFLGSQLSAAELCESLKPLVNLAARDNVQYLALLACLEAGSHFSICANTLESVQKHVESSPPVINAIGGTIGLSSSDSTTLLAQSDDGLRFLAVTLPLLATVGPVAAAQVLDAIFERISFKNVDKPHVQYIQDILRVLEARCQIQLFKDFIDKYRTQMTKIVSSREPSALGSSETSKDHGGLLSVPTPGAIVALFENFRNDSAQALGAPAKHTSIETPPATPWIPAFAE
jgi:hypothetical protein